MQAGCKEWYNIDRQNSGGIMKILEIVSYQSNGKSALCAGIGKKLLNTGKKTGYVKPVHVIEESKRQDCRDAFFIGASLELSIDRQKLCPLHLTRDELQRELNEAAEDFSAKVLAVCEDAAAGNEVLIIEGPGDLKDDQLAIRAGLFIAEKMNARVVMLIGYGTDFKDKNILDTARKFGDRLIGVVFNQVPENKLKNVKTEASEYFKNQGIAVLGAIPEIRALYGISVGELAEKLSGELITAKDKSEDLIENIMLGAMSPDSAIDYYNRKKNKAVVTRYDRADMQLAALETSTRCLIVSGGRPTQSVMVKADDKKIPVMVVEKSVNEIIDGIESALSVTKFHNIQKLQALNPLLDTGLDFKAINLALGL